MSGRMVHRRQATMEATVAYRPPTEDDVDRLQWCLEILFLLWGIKPSLPPKRFASIVAKIESRGCTGTEIAQWFDITQQAESEREKGAVTQLSPLQGKGALWIVSEVAGQVVAKERLTDILHDELFRAVFAPIAHLV